ncbi:MAG: cytochrome c [Gemmatimonadetes bacterium]|nr:cytochrome c [Gemmatimonadota bacterium]
MRSEIGRPRFRGLLRTAALGLALSASACVPMDTAIQAVFGRSMRDQPAFDPYENTLMPAEGSVSFISGNYPAQAGQVNLGEADGMGADVPPFTAADMASGGGLSAALVNPVPPTAESLARGKVVFERMCGVCHGPAGNPQEASILPKLQLMMAFPLANGGALLRSDGYIFGMITVGRGVMPAYGHQVPYYDRWNVVNYVRQLQGRIAAPAAAAPTAEGAPEPAAPAEGGR